MYSFSLLSGIPFDSVSEEVQRILADQQTAGNRKEELRRIFSLMDLTSLEGSDHAGKIKDLCRKAIAFGEKGLPFPAAVCIYTPFIAVAKEALKGTPIRVATVAAAFPHGQAPMAVKAEEMRYAVQEGADEIDIVISRGTFLEGGFNEIFREVDSLRHIAPDCTMKVILETGELVKPDSIARASEIAIEAGADFIKTSTGKITPAATPEAVYVMLRVIKAHYEKSGTRIGIKPAGGISDPAAALNYHHLVRTVLGDEWLTPELFRIGASRLADNISGILS